MARLALAVGYVSRTTSRSEQPELLYLGPSFQAAKEAANNPPAHLGYGEAYRLDHGPTKFRHVPGFVPPGAEEPAAEPALELLPDPPLEEPAAEEAEPEPEPDLDLGGKRPGRKP